MYTYLAAWGDCILVSLRKAKLLLSSAVRVLSLLSLSNSSMIVNCRSYRIVESPKNIYIIIILNKLTRLFYCPLTSLDNV